MPENRLVEIFEELRAAGLIRTKKEFAGAMNAGYANVINAMSGAPESLTPSLITRAERCRRQLLGLDAQAPARREITIPAETLELYTNLSRTAAQLAETLDRLLAAERGKKDAAG